MELALLWVISSVVGGGVCGALVISWGYGLRIARLEKHVLSQRLTNNANARWSSDDQLLKAMQSVKPASRDRFANDFE